MRGAGEADSLLPEPLVDIRGRAAIWVEGVVLARWAWTPELRFALLNRLLGSGDLFCGMTGDLPLLAFEFGDFALLDVSLSQFRRL